MAFSSTTSILLVGAILSWVGYRITVIVYSVFFGPLSKYPGPKFAAASRIPFAKRRLQGTDIHWVHKLHLKYGNVVRIAPNEISYTNGQAWKEIYGKYDSISHGVRVGQFQKDLPFYGKPTPGFKDIIRVNDPDHARARRNLSHAFSENSLKKQDGLIRHYIDLLVKKLDEIAEKGVECDIGRMFNYTTFDIMGDLSAGEDLGCLTGGDYHPQVAFIFGIFRMMPSFQEAQHFPLLAKFIQFTAPKDAAKAREEHLIFAKDRIDRRLARTDPRPDIVGIVTEAKEDFQLSKEELYGNMRLFMTAGTETSATTLTGLTWYLLMNPNKMTVLTNEIRAKFSSAAEIDCEILAKMPYLNACIEEALRVYPPVPGGLPRLVPPGGATICEGYVPQNTAVYVHQYATCHSPTNFKDPDNFIPERFLNDPEYASDDRSCFQPFSYGPRNCVGKNLSYLEMRQILAQVLWHFDLSWGSERPDLTGQRAFFLWEKTPFPVVVKRVSRS